MATGMGVSAMIHAVGIIGAIVWFGLNGLLGYAKPSDFVWLAGSAILGVSFFARFFWYLALADRFADNADC
jgi:hypothetical protein